MAKRTRGKGEGNIYCRADGRWVARLSIGYANGVRKRKSLYDKTRAEVAALLNETLQCQKNGAPMPDGRLTVAGLTRRWLESIKPPVVRPRTYQFY